MALNQSTTLWRHRLISLLTTFMAAYVSMPAHGTFYFITQLSDDLDDNNGTCVLREAIIAANTNSPYDACLAVATTLIAIVRKYAVRCFEIMILLLGCLWFGRCGRRWPLA